MDNRFIAWEEKCNVLVSECRGIDIHEGKLYFTAKYYRELIILDLDTEYWTWSSTVSGAFEHQPDQVNRIVQGDAILYFCEDGGPYARGHHGIHGRDGDGRFYSILNNREFYSETTGLAFSPDGIHMYFSQQDPGIIYDIKRVVGMPFNGTHLDILYHDLPSVTETQ